MMIKKFLILICSIMLIFSTISVSNAELIKVYDSSFRETSVIEESIESKEVGRYYQATIIIHPKHGDKDKYHNGNMVLEIRRIMAFDPVNPKFKDLFIEYITTFDKVIIKKYKNFHTISYLPANDMENYSIWKFVTFKGKERRR